MPKVSIIVPVYNAEKTLKRCLDSILSQSYGDFELLLINDGCTDLSGKICDEYAKGDSRVKAYHKQNGGVSSARNLGLDEANGEYVLFVDADDWICDDLISTALNYDEDIIAFNFYEYDIHENTTRKDSEREDHICLSNQDEIGEFIRDNFFDFSLPMSCAKLIKRNMIGEDLRFDPKIRFGEDTLFMILLSNKITSFRWISDCKYFYYMDNLYKKYYLGIEDASIHLKVFMDCTKACKHLPKNWNEWILNRNFNCAKRDIYFHPSIFLHNDVFRNLFLEMGYTKHTDLQMKLFLAKKISETISLRIKSLFKKHTY